MTYSPSYVIQSVGHFSLPFIMVPGAELSAQSSGKEKVSCANCQLQTAFRLLSTSVQSRTADHDP